DLLSLTRNYDGLDDNLWLNGRGGGAGGEYDPEDNHQGYKSPQESLAVHSFSPRLNLICSKSSVCMVAEWIDTPWLYKSVFIVLTVPPPFYLLVFPLKASVSTGNESTWL